MRGLFTVNLLLYQPRHFSSAMTLSTLINSGLTRPTVPRTALVLMGGGARTAYQAGVLRAISAMLRLQEPSFAYGSSDVSSFSAASPGTSIADQFPFQILVGTSAGALNAGYLAARATQGLAALDALAQFWQDIRSHHVYRLDVSPWVRASKIAAAWSLSKQVRAHGAVLDNMPLVDTLHHAISLTGIEDALKSKALHALAVTSSSYSSGTHWTFCHTGRDSREKPWTRPGRRAEFSPINIEHLMASSAIPLIFPAMPLWVDGHKEYFGDGSMRQISPLSPAIHLGAHKVLVLGVGQPQRSGFIGSAAHDMPTVGSILGHAMASVFHDTLQSDVEQAQRMNATLRELPREVAAVLPYRSVDVMSIQPSESLDDIALAHISELPESAHNALAGLGALSTRSGGAGLSQQGEGAGNHPGSGAAALASYLLFEPGFVNALMALGERDAFAHKAQLLAFLRG